MDRYSGDSPRLGADTYGNYPPPSVPTPQINTPPMYGQQRPVYQPQTQSPYLAQGQVQPQAQSRDIMQTELTQEDYLFLKKWKNDCFMQRSLPLMTLTCGAQFYYNKTKLLPHNWFRYTSLIVTSYFVGVFSFRNEFKRRIATSQSNSPFMQRARATLGLPPLVSSNAPSFGYEAPMNAGPDAAIGSYSSDNYSTNAPRLGGSGNMAFGYNEDLNADWTNDNTVDSPISLYATPPPVAPSNAEHFNPLPEQINPINQAGGLTYDELRARNRGLIR